MSQEQTLTGKQLGNYRLLSRLSYSSRGSVYLGQHAIFTHDPVVAIKILHTSLPDDEEREDFIREALVLKKLSHPYILPVIDAGIQNGIAYIVTAYASHGTLRAYLDQQQGHPLPLDEALTILVQIGEALQHAHEYNIVHRDLKPANILFNEHGETLLADFGLAATLHTAHSQQLNASGTPAYMAPEQFEGIVSTKSDQYSLGCIAYELVTGRGPFDTEQTNLEVVWYQHARVQPVPPTFYNPDIPPHVEHAIMTALAKQRSDRYAAISLFIDTLRQPVEPAMVERYRQLETVEQALRSQPATAQLYQQQGNLLCGLKEYEQAVYAYEQALSLDGELAMAYNNQGFALSRLKRYPEALEALQQAILLDGAYAVAYINLSNTLCELHRYQEALSVIDYALLLEPDQASAHSHRGNALYGSGHTEEALLAYEEALQLNPDLALAHYGKGRALHELKRYEAIQSYERALRLDAKLTEAYKGKGNFLVDYGFYEEALLSYEHALHLDPHAAELYTRKGEVLSTLQRYEEARAAYEQALRLDPDLAVSEQMRETWRRSARTNTPWPTVAPSLRGTSPERATESVWPASNNGISTPTRVSSPLQGTQQQHPAIIGGADQLTWQNEQDGNYRTMPLSESTVSTFRLNNA
ncbi:MAG TPA: serine/threonine-protein kinase [Ktedonosporobacter sp.]|nr:serine/threonine-protein kinase [Ktedonosporobacter sp.]